MAEDILKLKVNSQEYDSKIKRAAEGIVAFARDCKESGKALSSTDGDTMRFVQALGKMDTVATTTKQQLREMSNALTTLTMTYRGLTDEEKTTPFGQELAKGIQQLTERAGQAKDAMMDVEMSIKNAASDTRMFDQMAQGMSVATAGFQGLTGAGKLLGIEMGNDVEVIAKLQAALAVTNSLTTIQNALQKESAFMQGLNAAKTSLAVVAQQAYAVATGEATVAQAAFNVMAEANPYGLIIAGVGATIGLVSTYIALTDDSTEAQERWQEALKESEARVNNLTQAFTNLKYAMDLRGVSDKELYDAEIAALEKKRDELKGRLGNKDVSHDEWMQIANEVKKANEEISKLIQKRTTYLNEVNRLRKPGAVDNLNTERELESAMSIAKAEKSQQQFGSTLYNFWDDLIVKINNKIKNSQTETVKAIAAKTATTASNAQKSFLSASIGEYENAISELRKAEKNVTTNEEWVDLEHRIGELTIKVKELKGELKTVPASISDGMNAATDAQNKRIEDRMNDSNVVSKGMANIVKQIEREQQGGKTDKKYLVDGFAELSGGLNALNNGFAQLGIDLGDGLNEVIGGIQAVTNILTGIQALVSAIEIISSADAVIPFYRGGIVHAAGGWAGGTVPGNRMSADQVPALLNSGEMVLTRFQQQALAASLQDGGVKNIRINGHLEGEDLALAIDTWGKRTGRGELCFFKNQ